MSKYLLIVILLLLLICSVLTKCNRIQSAELATSKQTVAALTDSIRVIKDKHTGQVTLQKPVFTERLDRKQVKLTTTQKHLFKAVDKKTVAAAVVTSSTQLRNVVNTTPTLSADSVQVFRSHTDSLSYTITVRPGKLTFDSLDIHNTTTIIFSEVKRQQVVNVTNSNPLLKVSDIQGYTVPKRKSWISKIINTLF